MFEENPYQAPSEVGSGSWDWTLAKRMAVVLVVILSFYAAAAEVSWWMNFNRVSMRPGVSVVEQVKAFFTDWKSLDH